MFEILTMFKELGISDNVLVEAKCKTYREKFDLAVIVWKNSYEFSHLTEVGIGQIKKFEAVGLWCYLAVMWNRDWITKV